MTKRLLLIGAFVAAVSLTFCVAEVMGGPPLSATEGSSPCVLISSSFAYGIRCDSLTKASTPSGISSRYIITNLGTSTATTAHDFYAEGTDWQVDPSVANSLTEIGVNDADEFDLADVSIAEGNYYVIVMSDEPITGTVFPPSATESPGTIFLPFVIKQPPAPQEPLVRGETVRFLGAWEDVQLEGQVALSEYRSVLVDDYSGPVYPDGIFVVAVMDVTNLGLVSDEVGYYSSFKVKDSVGRQFDLADVSVQLAARDEYGYESIYEPIQPGFTRRLVFVFDVLPASEDLHLISLSPW